jgi:glycine dehydrogenase subunit 2
MRAEIGGFSAVSLQPAAGAHGELTGMFLMRAFHAKRKNRDKNSVLIPDSAHGTNPASAAMAGFEAVQVVSGRNGRMDIDDFRSKLNEQTAGIMITNPNTLGLFEGQIAEIAKAVHEADGIVYMDGANFNALVGNVRPGELGVDIMHFNLHKTFSTPHGGGGPGAGPIGVSEKLEPFLPVPRVEKRPDGSFSWKWDSPETIGQVHGYYGNFLVLVRAYTYLLIMGKTNLRRIGEDAILNANYLLGQLKQRWEAAFKGPVAHEFVLSAKKFRQYNVKALDIAKRLIDMGYHPPTIYFPLIVPEALMIEPTETESKETLDAFAACMNQIALEAEADPARLQNAPLNAPVGRLDEAKAAKELKVNGLPFF